MTFKTSVVIPLYNKEKFVIRALDSIRLQELPVDQVVIINDGSTDDSAQIVASYREKHPSFNITFIEQPNAGVSVARNNGIKAAENDWVLFLDADDYWLPHFTREIQQLAQSYPQARMLATAYGFETLSERVPANLKHVPNKMGIIENYFLACCHADLPITASNVAIAKSVLVELDGFKQGMAMGEDQLLWSSVACKYPVAFSNVLSAYYDKAVEDSACKVNHIVELAPHIPYWIEDLHRDRIPHPLIPALKYLIHLSVLYCVKNNICAGNKKKARDLLFNNRYLQRDKYWWAGLLLSYLPLTIVRRVI